MWQPLPVAAACTARLPVGALRAMVRLVRGCHRLTRSPAYLERVAPRLPEVARYAPGHDAVMMGYDFHLAAEGPRLIEVNTNAGGFLLAFAASHQASDWREAFLTPSAPGPAAILHTFAQEWGAFRGGPPIPPGRVVILDAAPDQQYLYPEMTTLAELFRRWGVAATVADPAELAMSADGVSHQGERVDLIYNRHCDFYLETPPLAGLRAAYLAGQVCLTPNPRQYGLLADKARLPLLGDAGVWTGASCFPHQAAALSGLVPESAPLAEWGLERAWAVRRELVFKPMTSFGGRGVLLGEKISRKRFDTLEPHLTLVQRRVPPTLTPCPPQGMLKTDFRLFAYRDRVLGVAARLYQGQVTNFREAGSGYAPVRVERAGGGADGQPWGVAAAPVN